MAKKVEKLKKFYIANGGDASAVANIKTVGGMIDALCNIEFDSELPSVTTDDNGKVLSVVAGNWNKANAPTELPAVTGSDNGKVLAVAEGAWAKSDVPSNNFVVAYSIGEGSTISANKTLAEITAAISSGKNVIASMASGFGDTTIFGLLQYSDSKVVFGMSFYNGSDLGFAQIDHDENTIAMTTKTITVAE